MLAQSIITHSNVILCPITLYMMAPMHGETDNLHNDTHDYDSQHNYTENNDIHQNDTYRISAQRKSV